MRQMHALLLSRKLCSNSNARPQQAKHQRTCEQSDGQLRDHQVLQWDVGTLVAGAPVKRLGVKVKGAAEHAALLREGNRGAAVLGWLCDFCGWQVNDRGA